MVQKNWKENWVDKEVLENGSEVAYSDMIVAREEKDRMGVQRDWKSEFKSVEPTDWIWAVRDVSSLYHSLTLIFFPSCLRN